MQKNNNYSLKIAVKLKIFHLRRLPAAHFPSAKPQSGTGKKITRFHWPEAWSPQAKFQISTSFFDSLILRLSQVFASEVLMILHDYSCFKKLFSVLCNKVKKEKKKFPFDDNHNSGILSQRKKRRRVWTDVTVSVKVLIWNPPRVRMKQTSLLWLLCKYNDYISEKTRDPLFLQFSC